MTAKKNEPDVPLEEHRAVDDEAQLLALAQAEAAGILPDEDRREPEPVVEPEVIPPATADPAPAVVPTPAVTSDLHVIREREDGVRVDGNGCVIT